MKTILIVDDTFENLYLLRVILEEVGYVVVEAKDGKEGLEKLHEYNVDLIISDILMPVMDGYMFCQACKKEESFKDIPFVFYTSTYTEALDEDFAIKLGADQFLRKPTDQNKITAVVQGLFGKVKLEAEPLKNVKFTEEEVLKLYSKRLISKLEHKNLDLEKEVLEREKAEQLLIHKNEILDLIALNIPLNEIFDRLLLNYQSVHPDYYGSISLMDQDGMHLNLESAPSLPEFYKLAVKKIPIGPNVGSCGSAAFHKKSVIVSNISTDPLWVDYKNIALKFKLNSCWSIPIFGKDKTVIGTFAIYSKSINAPSLSDIRELNFTLNLVNLAIEKSRIVAEIKKKDESYRALIDQANDAIISYSLDGEIHDFNKAAYISLGYTKNEFLNLKIEDFNVGGFIQNEENHNRLLAGEAIIFARKFLRKDKSLLDLEVSAKLQKDGKILGIARDVTERKKAELKLLESEYSLRQSQIVANIGSYTVDIPTKVWESSAVLNKIFGIDKSYLKTETGWSDIIHPDQREEVLAYYDNCVQNRKKINIEYRAVRIDNHKEIWVHARGEFLFDDDANPIKIIGTTQDITERKKAEVKLKESEYNLRKSQIVGNIGSYAIDLNTSTWEGSAVLDGIFGINETYEKTVESWGERIHPDEREGLLSYFEYCVLNNKRFNKEYRILKLDTKEEIWVHGIGELVFDKEANPIKLIGTIQDITHRKHSELKLQESEKSLLIAQEVAKIGSFNLCIKNLVGDTSITFNNIIGVNSDVVVDFDLWKSIVHQEDRSLIKENVFESQNSKRKFDLEYRIITKDKKELKWVHGLGEVVYLNGEAKNFVGTIQDITERKNIELDL
ncbi:MAG: PAS domain-containing protein, partial [Oceanihabitans sp.]|nr:PAS domain-containing protein [Oceanihabitans sp.]